MSTVQEVAFMFDYSGKKLQAFFDELEADATTKENMGGGERTKLRTLCEARWTSQGTHCIPLRRHIQLWSMR
jgi:hypothetical protein